jgi:hypothetical protein
MTRHESLPVLPGPDCATIAPLLPLLDTYDLSNDEVARARAHLRACDWCSREYAAHVIVGDALRRHFGASPQDALPLPFLTMESIVNNFDTQDTSGPLSTVYAPTTSPGTPPNHPRHGPSRLTGIVAVAAALLLVLFAGLIFSQRAGFLSRGNAPGTRGATATSTTITPTPKPTHLPTKPIYLPANTILGNLSMDSATDGWGYGYVDNKNVVILHLQNGQWSVWSGQVPRGIWPYSISMTSPTEGWIAGAFGSSGGFLHYSNGTWTAVHVPGSGIIRKVVMASATEGWAADFKLSTDNQSEVFGMLHYSNGAWAVAALPAGLDRHDVVANETMDVRLDFAAPAAGESWLMVKNTSRGDTQILRYANGTFNVAYTLPQFQGRTFVMNSLQNGWLTGTDTNGAPVTYHFDGSAWAPVALPSSFNHQYTWLTVATSPSGEDWLFNAYKGVVSSAARYQRGAWVVVQGPGAMNASSFVMASAAEGWGFGFVSGSVNPMIYQYQNGDWSVYGVR